MILFINYLSEKINKYYFKTIIVQYIIQKLKYINLKTWIFCKDNFINKKIHIIKFKDLYFDNDNF